MRRCLELAVLAAKSDMPVLILGRTGTGKTLLAQAIHNSSARATSAFVSFNASAMSDTLLESELFGHEPPSGAAGSEIDQADSKRSHTGSIAKPTAQTAPARVSIPMRFSGATYDARRPVGINAVKGMGVDSNKQSAIHESATPPVGKEPCEKPIRLNDLIPKRDVKGGRRAVFGAIRARPGNSKQK